MKNYDKVILETYRSLFKAATPSTDFDKLVADAKAAHAYNDYGQVVIDFNCCELLQDELERICNEVGKQHKLKKPEIQKLINTVCLGCSPKTKQ